MTYFSDHYDNIRYPIASDSERGLHRGQLGAIHSIASHFTISSDPAVVTMPTGSRKTAVLILSAFLLQARRVLVVTPSRLVRNQIAEEFRTLGTLRAIHALVGEFSGPGVYEMTSRITSDERWTTLETNNVVVATPNSISPGLEGIPQPPSELFDLVLVDEAHHSPARIWNELVSAFPAAKRILFTATPFRRDRREIKGRFIYTYPISEAFKDRVFGEIQYIPVQEKADETNDVSIAKEAERIVIQDRTAGFAHYLMVRTDSKKRAEELDGIYKQHTQLNLQVVHSDHSYRHIKQTIRKLHKRELDGIICVDMLGEGFDFPNLKIAAIHIPHRSLAATIQFIGRFARTNAPDIGKAKFIAVPSEISIEATNLYEEGAIWQQAIPGLLESRVQAEIETRATIASFKRREAEEVDTEDLSLYSLRPYFHVKIFQPSGEVSIGNDVKLPEPLSVVHRWVSGETSSVVLVSKEVTRPKWISVDAFDRIEYDLFVIYYDVKANLLFVCASRKSDRLYENIARQFGSGQPRILPLSIINRALRGLSNSEFFNIGMRNRVRNNNTESYRIVTGANVHNAIRKSDSRLYHRGHIFGRAQDGEKSITIGLSSSSKVWSNTSAQVPQLIDWCKNLAARLASDAEVTTGTRLDYLNVGESVTEIPEGVIAADWDKDAYFSALTVSYDGTNGEKRWCQLLDLDLVIDQSNSDKSSIRVIVQGNDVAWPLVFSLSPGHYFDSVNQGQVPDVRDRGKLLGSLLDYLNSKPLKFYFADFSMLDGDQIFRAQTDGLTSFPKERIETPDWSGNGVDITLEYGNASDGKCSIHAFLKSYLQTQGFDIVFYDHRPGELADFLCVEKRDEAIYFTLYHCKASKEAKPGDRVEYLYEVCGQAAKAVIWLSRFDALITHAKRRLKSGSEFIVGDLATLENVVGLTRKVQPSFSMVVVQPGISASNLSEKLLNILAAASDFLATANCDDMRVMGSP